MTEIDEQRMANITLRIPVAEKTLLESLLRRENQLTKAPGKKDKSLNEFLRENLLLLLLNLDENGRIYNGDILQRLEEMEKWVRRSLSLLYQWITFRSGDEKARELLRKSREVAEIPSPTDMRK
jgi:hypothetical protein